MKVTSVNLVPVQATLIPVTQALATPSLVNARTVSITPLELLANTVRQVTLEML